MNSKTYMILRIVFCILAVALCAVAIFVFVYAGWQWGLLCVFAAVLFAGLMLVFRRLQSDKEQKENPPEPKGDFITGPAHVNDDADDGDESQSN